MNLDTIEARTATEGLTRELILDWFRAQPSSDSLVLRESFTNWVDSLRTAGVAVDEDMAARVDHDLARHYRLTHETIIGAPHAPYVSLNHKPEFHFGDN